MHVIGSTVVGQHLFPVASSHVSGTGLSVLVVGLRLSSGLLAMAVLCSLISGRVHCWPSFVPVVVVVMWKGSGLSP